MPALLILGLKIFDALDGMGFSDEKAKFYRGGKNYILSDHHATM